VRIISSSSSLVGFQHVITIGTPSGSVPMKAFTGSHSSGDIPGGESKTIFSFSNDDGTILAS
jgi:hypothetical protein